MSDIAFTTALLMQAVFAAAFGWGEAPLDGPAAGDAGNQLRMAAPAQGVEQGLRCGILRENEPSGSSLAQAALAAANEASDASYAE